LKDLVPLYRTSRDEIVTQFDMIGLEKLSLLKMDFLGLTTLTIIHDAIRLIARLRGVEIMIEDLPLDDAKTYEIFSKGYTSGVFQFESQGMRDILRRYEPSRVEDLCALNALYRPGPIQGGMIDDFIERKLGRKEVSYDLPVLREILEETYGVIVYQEQVIQISNLLAGYSLGEADLLRRAMGKKKAEEMASQRARFIKGAVERGFPQKKVEKIFDLMEQFAGYGFNKSHSAAYAYLAYVTAYLKSHYPLEFMSALLTSETGNTAKIVKYINECRDMGICVLPPDVNHSELNFIPDGDGIRFGLGAIRNLGPNPVEAIVTARQRAGRFRSLYHFAEEVDLSSINRRILESIIKAGAMDSFGAPRSRMLAALESAMEAGQRATKDRLSGQAGLFGLDFAGEEHPDPPLPDLPEWTQEQKLAGEKEMLGIYVTGHPLDPYREKIRDLTPHTTESLEGLARGVEVKVCGILTGIQRRRNKEGKLFAVMRLEDWLGSLEAMVFNTAYETQLPHLAEDKAVMARALVLPEESGPPRLNVQEIIPLELARVNYPTLISIRVGLGAPERAEALRELIQRKPGETDIRLRLEKPRDFAVILDLSTKVHPDREFLHEVERICGVEAVEVLAS
jgi:DNA polymerase-3 subunit alpha